MLASAIAMTKIIRIILVMAIPAGLEPATYCLEGSCSIQLS